MLNRTSAPLIAPPSVPALLPHSSRILSNGIEIIYIHDPAQEVFKIDAIFEAGVYYQPQPLVASTTINMLNEGTSSHSAEAIADIFDYYGAYIDYNCGLNKVELSLVSLNKYAEETIPLLAELITESTIPEKELEIFLRNKRQEYLVSIEKTAYLAQKKFSKLLFGEQHPYANSITGNDYEKITAPLIRDFYHRHINAATCKLVLCGNINDHVLQITEKYFSTLPGHTGNPGHTRFSFQPALPGYYHIPKDSSVQSSLRIGKQGVRLTDQDYAGFQLLNTVLGGYFGSRLMSNIREEKGYTYGIQSFNVSMPQSSYWCISTDVNNQYTAETIREIFKEIGRLQTEPVPDEELALVKNFLHGDLLRELDGVFSQSDALKHKLNYGLDNHIYVSIIEKIKNCTPGELIDLANKYWNIDEMYIVTAGKEKT